MQLSEAEEQRDSKATEAKEFQHALLKKDQELQALKSQLRVLQQRTLSDEAVGKQVYELIAETSILRVKIAEAESERQGISQNVKLALWYKKDLEEWMASLQQTIGVSVNFIPFPCMLV